MKLCHTLGLSGTLRKIGYLYLCLAFPQTQSPFVSSSLSFSPFAPLFLSGTLKGDLPWILNDSSAVLMRRKLKIQSWHRQEGESRSRDVKDSDRKMDWRQGRDRGRKKTSCLLETKFLSMFTFSFCFCFTDLPKSNHFSTRGLNETKNQRARGQEKTSEDNKQEKCCQAARTNLSEVRPASRSGSSQMGAISNKTHELLVLF